MGAFNSIIIENLNRRNLTEKDWERTISINDGDITPRIKKMPAKKVQQLIKNGEEATANYFWNTLQKSKNTQGDIKSPAALKNSDSRMWKVGLSKSRDHTEK